MMQLKKALRRHKSAEELARGMPKPSNRYQVKKKESEKVCVFVSLDQLSNLLC